MAFDVAAVRARFPALASGTAHFDGPGGSQTPDVVADAMRSVLVSSIANRGSVTAAERTAEATVSAFRAAMGDFTTGAAGERFRIVHGRSMTTLAFDLARALAAGWRDGDEVVVSRLDHDANVRPWVLAAERAGATVRWIDFDTDSAELTVEHVAAQLGTRTRLLALTGASNLLGTRPDLEAIGRLVHEHDAVFAVDAVHLAAHAAVDAATIGADLLFCSPYKFFGPHCGVLTGRTELLESLRPDKLVPSSDAVPERFELGTLPYEQLAGTTAAVDFLASLGSGATRREQLVSAFAAIEEHEDRLRHRIEEGLAALPGVHVLSRAKVRTPTLLVAFEGHDPQAAYRFLAERDVNAPAGTFYAYETARHLGLGPSGALRIGLAPYNDDTDVDRLLDGLHAFTVR